MFINRPVKEQILEDAIDITIQWIYADDGSCYSRTEEIVTPIITEIIDDLQSRHSKHPLFSMSKEEFL
ncbi:hypothetical protein HN011_009511, partial [Eciton burchellii]